MWVGSDTKTASSHAAVGQHRGDRLERLERRPAAVLHEDRLVGDAARDGVSPGRLGLGRRGRPSCLPPVTTRSGA